jgi:integrase
VLHSTANRRLRLVHLLLNLAQGSILVAFLVYVVFDLEIVDSFMNWCVRVGRIQENLVRIVSKIDGRSQTTRLRRAFSDEELVRLMEVAPDYRALVYFTAARTGLRHGELKRLLWGDLRLDTESPSFYGSCEQLQKQEGRDSFAFSGSCY